MARDTHNFPRPPYEPNMLAAGAALALVVGAGIWATTSDKEPTPPRTGSFMKLTQDGSQNNLVGCFQESQGGPVGTLEIDPDEDVDPNKSTWRYKFTNYAGQSHPVYNLAALLPYEYYSYAGAFDTPEDKKAGSETICTEHITLPDNFPATAFKNTFFIVTHRSGQFQFPDSMTAPYTDKTTIPGGNVTDIPGYGKTQALRYDIPQPVDATH